MGTFSVSIEVGDPTGQRWEPVTASVDTGSSYTTIPRSILNRLGVEPRERRTFSMADDRRVRFEVGVTQVRIGGEAYPVIVAFGDDPGPVLLGAHTLETFGLGVDPVNKRLRPVDAWLLSILCPAA